MVHASSPLVSRFRLANVRGFRELEVDLRDELGRPRRRLVIIGRNGTCKTTLLRAIAIGLCDMSDANALAARPFGGLVSSRDDLALIEIQLAPSDGPADEWRTQRVSRSGGKEHVERDGDEVRWHSKDTRRVTADQSSWYQPFVCGYGAGRYGVGPESGREYRIHDSVYSLFDYGKALLDPELTLRRLKDFLGSRKYAAALRGIKRVLTLQDEDEIRLVPGGGVELGGPSVASPVRLEGWADGYRMTFSWLLDLYGWAMRADRIDDDGHVHGIVLVDELDQHLHPSMQSRILGHLAEVLPHVQLIATTHSPLVALGAEPDELLVLRRSGPDVVRVEHPPDFSLYSAEDMLRDEDLFDTLPYPPETEELLRKYNRLAACSKEQRSDAETKELTALARELQGQQLIPSADSEVAQELRSVLAKHGL